MNGAADHLDAPSSPDSFYSFVDHFSSIVLTMGAAQAVMLALMLTYLLTIRRKALSLARRIDIEAFD